MKARIVTLLFLAMPLAAQDRFDAMRQRLIENINQMDTAAIVSEFNDAMRSAVPEPALRKTIAGMRDQFGKIVGSEQLRQPSPGVRVYRLKFDRGETDMELALDQNGKVSGLRLKPAAPDAGEAPGKHATELNLPFRGKWLVFWGGDTAETAGHHWKVPNQRRALDLLGVGPDGKTHRNDGARNEDYYAFGREVLAPAGGTVIAAIDGVPDNTPGSLNPFAAVGNAVLIEHRPGEVSVLAHLRNGSVRVKKGDRVQPGDVVGMAGNSGNSSEPHLHYHLQTSTAMQDGAGIPIRFANVQVERNGKAETKTNYSPVKGDVISPPRN